MKINAFRLSAGVLTECQWQKIANQNASTVVENLLFHEILASYGQNKHKNTINPLKNNKPGRKFQVSDQNLRQSRQNHFIRAAVLKKFPIVTKIKEAIEKKWSGSLIF